MYINHDDLTALAGCKNPCEYLAEGERKIAALMAEVRNVICILSHHYCVLSYCVVVSFFSPLSRIVRSLPASLRFLCIVLLLSVIYPSLASPAPSLCRVERAFAQILYRSSARKLFSYDV